VTEVITVCSSCTDSSQSQQCLGCLSAVCMACAALLAHASHHNEVHAPTATWLQVSENCATISMMVSLVTLACSRIDYQQHYQLVAVVVRGVSSFVVMRCTSRPCSICLFSPRPTLTTWNRLVLPRTIVHPLRSTCVAAVKKCTLYCKRRAHAVVCTVLQQSNHDKRKAALNASVPHTIRL
jgi:hypothetical protein